ncbi:MAG TPA: hypothetical protein VHK70_08640 [Burkholderiaceae bacterium]|jgi:hypothetical protein|nr:hypothetical protein [Burkholderiaceae bacterium]
MASDKKDYVDTIEALTSLATITFIRNKLNKVRARTEDQKLIGLLDTAIRVLDAANVRSAVTLSLRKAEYGALHAYCRQVIDSIKPQWQILAECNGWASTEEKK